MKNTAKNKGFTLIEILIVMVVISFLTLAITNINFNAVSNKQQLQRYENSLIAYIETFRNNGVTGKWVGINLLTPDNWLLTFTVAWISSSEDSIGSYSNYDFFTFPQNFEITSLSCSKIDGTTSNVNNITMTITWDNISIWWDCDSEDEPIILIETEYQWSTWTISINTITGIIEN